MGDGRIKSKLGYGYSLKDALRRNPVTIMAGDNISAVALARIEELEADLDNLSDKLELERALTDGAHRRAGNAEAKLAKAVEILNSWLAAQDHCSIEEGVCCCGEDMEGHSHPMNCGHSPVDHGAYVADNLSRDTRATLTEINGGGDE